MLTVGLTGGIGCGKSTAVDYFRQLGVPVIDADVIAHQVVAKGEPALQEIVVAFGAQALQSDGTLNRAWLRQQVFTDAKQRQQLESILHPRIKQAILARITECQQTGAAYVLVDIPLLFEKHYQTLFDRVVVIDCLPEQQVARVKQRDASDEAVILGIMQSQWSREQRLQAATDVLVNQSTLAALRTQVEQLHHFYTKR